MHFIFKSLKVLFFCFYIIYTYMVILFYLLTVLYVVVFLPTGVWIDNC